MTRLSIRITPQTIVITVLLIVALLALVFIDSLIAAPKLLFGRSLSALAPSLFPEIIISALAILCGLSLIKALRDDAENPAPGPSRKEWLRGVAFFAVMTVYALTMEPIGFLLSTALAIALSTVLMGNRSLVQILALSLVAPVALYLAATRLLVVSLPELDLIERAYARLFGA